VKFVNSEKSDFLNEFAGISTLPQEIKRNFALMRELDDRSQGKFSLFLVNRMICDFCVEQ
jgi:hypothetical protein